MARKMVRSLSELAQIDGGKIDAAFRLNLAEVLDDIRERPSLETARKITITVTVRPKCDGRGQLEDVRLSCDIGRGVPKEQSRELSMGLVADKGHLVGLLYNDLAPEDHRQGTLDDVPQQETDDAARSD
jgi:hypothetical protein